ncbi:uncharacterized protein C8Q71DRAFT_813822 [Rhodofomes roseus]|uniref:Uncharacterized protein n=1 Tax=Rhodofomes roseus TaxID=34475 RepID=A0ABQ8K972_9APHY|nr:uncharacterized protein C8Q71DRAFT_813822 [Rhodofomes roseus]KAH9833853.1 hypothetical protein C8Q71DRAFT_813822 [Rhodofomes roseus]
MPQVYRRHSERIQRPPPEPRRRDTLAPQPTDADDSIVLSDLVRTGEASRLRRRGAMRIDHGQSSAPRPSPPSNALPPPVRPSGGSRFVVEPAMWGPSQGWGPSDASVEDELFNGGEWREWAGDDRGEDAGGAQLDEGRADGAQDDDEEGFVLFCGGEDINASSIASSSGTPYRPSLFPVSSAGSPSTRGAERTTRRTNGCGVLVHMRAFPQGPRGLWVGKQEASDVVVGLEADYFESSVVAKMMKSACGCVREGIACAICGNTLGTRYLPCQAASEGIFSHATCNHTPAAPPIGPTGPQYWRTRRPPSASTSTSSARTSSSFYLYTFFADHVSPSPAYAFPDAVKHSGGHAQAEPVQAPGSRPGSPPLSYGYRYTASPRPVSPYSLPSTAPNRAPSPDAVQATSGIPPSIYPVWAQGPPRTPPPQSFVRTPQLALNVPGNGTTSTGTLVEAGLPADETDVDTGPLDADGVLVTMEDVDEPNSPDKTTEMVWPGR